jgi:hypothetical protein
LSSFRANRLAEYLIAAFARQSAPDKLTERPYQAVSSTGGFPAEVWRMQGRVGRLWQLRRGRAKRESAGDHVVPGEDLTASTGDGVASADGLALPDPERPMPPEQPVLLMPSGGTRSVHVGELLPVRQRRWPLSVVRLPVVPKRAILAAGVCAGLAAPALARHLATRILLGRTPARVGGVLEVTRIVYTGPLTPRVATAIAKVLEAGRR